MDAAKMKDRPYTRGEVVEIIRSVLKGIEPVNEKTEKLYQELTDLAHYIETMRAELSQLRSQNIKETATDELDAVVGETAKATGTIMDSCDKIQALADKLPAEAQNEMMDAVTAIFEACSFQDITGQRITKVVKTLKNIEAKVGEILTTLGQGYGHTTSTAAKSDSLLNGPQLPSKASTQDDIDRLLASFDK